jgi:1,4-dihydroxy-2-naphthoate octaprenyltransferase
MTPGQIFMGGWVAMAVAAVTGAYLVYVTPGGTFLIWLIVIGGGFGVFYTAKPVEFKYKALGDVAVFVSFGPAMVLGAYFVQAHRFSWLPVLYAIPVGLLVDAILHSNNLRDIANDKVAKITTMPILIGERRAKAMYYGLVFGAYATTLLLVAFAQLTVFSLIVFFSFPVAARITNMVRHKSDIPIAQFAMIDAATAQLHLIFGLLTVIALVLQYFVIGPNG